MTRHTRNRQLKKINSIMESTWCLTIKDSVNHVWCNKIDPTFKWHRELTIFRGTVSANRVSFNHNGEYKNIKTK